jgi:hypothetical protein
MYPSPKRKSTMGKHAERRSKMRFMICLLIGALVVGCGGDDPIKTTGDPGPPLGTLYPDRQVIDPDNPVYEDAEWSQETVQQMFTSAKAQDAAAYRAYKAARQHAYLLEWAFCACGCDDSAHHVSAVDCFKDMHGYG